MLFLENVIKLYLFSDVQNVFQRISVINSIFAHSYIAK